MSDQPVDFNLEELKELIRLLRESNVAEFELRKADYRLRIRHGNLVEPAPESAGSAEVTPRNGAASQQQAALIEAAAIQKREEEDGQEVRSPMVGTFYRSASPGSASFIEIGDRVRKGQVLCIIEAMKIMNEIESDLDGEVRKIHVTNGQPVEFGEPLFSIKPVD